MNFQIPETKPMTAKEEIYHQGLVETNKRLWDARDKLRSINEQIDTLQKSRLIWLDEMDRLSTLLAKAETE